MDLTDLTFSPHSIPTAVAAVVTLSLGLRAVLPRRRSPVDISFAIMTVPIGIWLIGFSFMHSAATVSSTLEWARLSYLGVPFIPVGAYQFAAAVLGIRKRRRKLIWIFWIVAALFSIVAISSDLVLRRLVHYPWGNYPQYETLGSILLAYIVGVVLFTLVEYWNGWRQASPGMQRSRIGTFGVGFAIASMALVDDAPKYGIDVYPFGPLPVLAFIVIAAWAIGHYDRATGRDGLLLTAPEGAA